MLRSFLALAACLFSAASSAGSFNVAPIRIELPAARRAASIEVQNSGDAAAQLQVERFLWKRDNGGDDDLEATEAFLVTPPIFTLQPGQRQIVRVLMQVPPDPRRDHLLGWLRDEPRISAVTPKGAFYLFPSVAPCLSAGGCRTAVDFADRLLREEHVVTTPGEAFDAPGHLRLSYATSLDRLREGATRLMRFARRLV